MALTITPNDSAEHDALIGPNQRVIDMRPEIQELEDPPWRPYVGLLMYGLPTVLAIAALWEDTWGEGDEERILWLSRLYRPKEKFSGWLFDGE